MARLDGSRCAGGDRPPFPPTGYPVRRHASRWPRPTDPVPPARRAGEPAELEADWTPWEVAFDDGKAPYFEWFRGGLTSAAFNEVDRHVLAGHGAETAFVSVGPAAFEAALAGGSMLDECTRISRRELLAYSALNAAVLREAGLTAGDTLVMMLPHCVEQMCWIQAAKRLGVIYTCLPESISVASLAGRIFDTSAKLIITSTAKSSVESTSHKALVSHAVMDYVSMEAVLRAIRRVLPEQRWRSNSGKVDIKAVCEALEHSFKGDGAVSPKEVASKLEMVFAMNPPLKEKALALAAYLMEEMKREHAARVKTRLLVIPTPRVGTKPGATPSPPGSLDASPRADRRAPRLSAKDDGGLRRVASANYSSSKDAETSAQLGSLILDAQDIQSRLLPAFLEKAGVESSAELLKLPDKELVQAVWKALPPTPLSSMFPKNVVYTSGSSGYKATGLVQDTGGYCSGVSHTMSAVFDAVAGEDVIFTDAAPSWVTGQTYGITGPLCRRVTSVICAGMPEATMAQCLAAVVTQLKVTIFNASASFLKRALKTTWQAAWLQRQRLDQQLRVAASCGEPLSPAMHRLGMAVLTPNYINSYWASEHGCIILGTTYGNRDQPNDGMATMHAMPWVNAEVWLPVGEATDDGRMRFLKADPATASSATEATELASYTGGAGGGAEALAGLAYTQSKWAELKGRLVVSKPWPSMARTVWGDAELAATSGWVGDLDTYRLRYWSTFCDQTGDPVTRLRAPACVPGLRDRSRPHGHPELGELGAHASTLEPLPRKPSPSPRPRPSGQVMALDLGDLARPWASGCFSVLGHSREELRLGPEGMRPRLRGLRGLMLGPGHTGRVGGPARLTSMSPHS